MQRALVSPLFEPLVPRALTAAGQGGTGVTPPIDTPDAQLVLNKPAKTGFTYWIRLL